MSLPLRSSILLWLASRCHHRFPFPSFLVPLALRPLLLASSMPHVVASASSSSLKGAWRPTKIMNMKDLSRDDDFLSHLLVEKLGTGSVPLVVHKMDPSRILPKSDADQLLQIIRRVRLPLCPVLSQFSHSLLSFCRVAFTHCKQLVSSKGPPQTAIRNTIDDLLGSVPLSHSPSRDATLIL